MKPKFPIHISLNLSGPDGNAFIVLGKTTRAMKLANVAPQIIGTYEREAKAGDCDNLLDVTRRYVTLIDTSKDI